MKSLFLLLLPAALIAAPSTELPSEWLVPLETANGFALVNKANGQVFIHQFSDSNAHTESGPWASDLSEVSGVTSGINTAGTEHLALASATSNAVRFLPIDGSEVVTFQTDEPGPAALAPLRQNIIHPETVLIHSRFASNGEELEMWRSPLGLRTKTDTFDVSKGLKSFQSFRIPGTVRREAVGLRGKSLNRYARQFANIQESVVGDVSAGSRFATEVMGTDGRLCTLAWIPEKTATEIVTMPFLGFAAAITTSNELPFAIGSISAMSSDVPNANGGALITSVDGATAAYVEVVNGTTLNIVTTITASEGQAINGLAPVPGRGFLVLEGSPESRLSSAWSLYRNDGDGWGQVSSGSFTPWLSDLVNFATLFWFQGSPLLDPDSRLVKLESQSQWTNKVGAADIPAQIGLAELQAPELGLISTGTVPTNTPASATFLMTNQFAEDISVTALGSSLNVSRPALDIQPASGTYQTGVEVFPRFSESSADLFVRRESGPWEPFTALTVGYPSTWHFHARDKLTGATSAIVTRSYEFPLDLLNSIDSDGDTVPDYVEVENDLDPQGGNDSDGDFQSDLEELIAGTDPTDGKDSIEEDDRLTLFQGEGFQMRVQLRKSKTAEAGLNLPLKAHGMNGALLDEATTEDIDGETAAQFVVSMAVPERDWTIVSSPRYFEEDGRETIRVVQRPVITPPVINHEPTGNNSTTDSNNWISAAEDAHKNHTAVSALTFIDPVDNLIAALAEHALHATLVSTPGVPEDPADFTLFPFRDGEVSKVAFSPQMKAALEKDGWDFPALLTLLDSGVRNFPDLSAFAEEIYDLHVAESESTPFMLLPLDAFRSLLRAGEISHPSGENPYAGVETDAAEAALEALLAQVPGTRRPTATWTLIIQPATTPLHNYDYRRAGNNNLAWLVDRLGRRTQLEQGLGLISGATFTVTGYIDVEGPEGFDTMEVLTLDAVITPSASDSDTNANLLDDEWERFFFGELGAVGPFDPHPVSGHSYLQYHLSGADPRAGDLTGPIEMIMPIEIELEWIPEDEAYFIEFKFPDAYLDMFQLDLFFGVALDDFQGPAQVGNLESLGNNCHRFQTTSEAANQEQGFFQIVLSLK